MKFMTFSKFYDGRGQALVELALVLPLLVLLFLGVFDFSRAIHAKNIITNVSREGANMASRSSLAPQDIMNALAWTARPLDMQNKGMMYVTVVQGTGGDPTIQSQTAWANAANTMKLVGSRLGAPTPSNPNPPVRSLASLGLKTGQKAQVIEVFYKYQNVFSFNSGRLSSQYYSMAVF